MAKKFGYTIPYRRSQNGIEVLVGDKQVLSFEAIANQRVDGAWKNIDFNNPINPKGQVQTTQGTIGTRFNGMLLPGGGKPCFFGGSANGNESHDGAARREFNEELKLQVEDKAWNGRLERVFVTDWGGQYFAVDVGSLLPAFDWDAHLDSLRQSSAQWEQLALQNVVRSAWYPEMHQVRWLSARDAQRLLQAAPDEARMRSEVVRFANYVMEKTRVNVDDQTKRRFVDGLVAYMKQQDVADNANALEALMQAK